MAHDECKHDATPRWMNWILGVFTLGVGIKLLLIALWLNSGQSGPRPAERTIQVTTDGGVSVTAITSTSTYITFFAF